MQDSAADGTIVIVNITRISSDAILTTRGAVRPLRLPSLRASEVEVWLRKDWRVDPTLKRDEKIKEGRRKNDEFLQYLSWLWENCVKQILEAIQRMQDPQEQEHGLPRVWWIGTGLASSIPFHAAGNHHKAPNENAYSMSISSYIPSIKALAHARSRIRRTEKATGPLLFAAMPTTPSARALRGVETEKDHVVDAVGRLLRTTVLDHPSADQVVNSLQDCSIAHFACHGYTDSMDPSNSGLILQKSGNGGDGPEQDMLTVHRISELDLGCAQVAYLSACSTASNSAERLSDEVIHVVSGFQVAGFPHVVGCLWPSIDWACVEVAHGFYAKLLRREHWWSEGAVPSALREAVMELRAEQTTMPLWWAQFVHYGV
jgi:CHAT domain-containing protein